MTFIVTHLCDVPNISFSVYFIGDIHSKKSDWYLHHQRTYNAPMQTFLPPNNSPSYHLLPHSGSSQNGCHSYQYSDPMNQGPGPSDAQTRTYHGRSVSYDTNTSLGMERLDQNEVLPPDCVVWSKDTCANIVFANKCYYIDSKFDNCLLIYKSFRVIPTSEINSQILQRKNSFNISAKLFEREAGWNS